MQDFKGNELRVGDKVITISGSYGARVLYEGTVVRLTKMKAEVAISTSKSGVLKDINQLFKLLDNA